MNDEKDLIQAMRAEYAARQLYDFDDAISYLSQHLESPIERVLLVALLLEKPLPYQGYSCHPSDKGSFTFADDDLVLDICIQRSEGPYRADFYLNGWREHKQFFQAIIECDGHDYHERTKEQARHDKRRDRWFQTRGISVLRFAGSEIWADPSACAEQVYEAFWEAARRSHHD